jgi:hypothetical protein
MSPEHPANLDAGNPCRHDEDLQFHPLWAQRKIMNHFVVTKDSDVALFTHHSTL